ncbi:MAG TPA: DUF222 domain-containing protein [Microbacterium sp.]|nr:DUF222 domain-containing protein [Microbacterium sp.]
MQEPPVIPAEIEALLWAEREQRAAEWVDPYEVDPDAVELAALEALLTPTLVPATEADLLHREHLVGQWEHAVSQVARWEAVKQRVLAESLDYALADGTQGATPDLRVRSMAAELAWAVGMSDRTIAGHMADAAELRDRFPSTFEVFAAGRVSRAQVMVIVDEGRRIDDDAARAEYESLILDLATEPTTTGRLRATAKAVAEQLIPTTLTDRHRAAREDRRVEVREADDAMAQVTALVPAALGFGLHDRLTQMARVIAEEEKTAAARATTDGEAVPSVRTLDQIRADLFCDLLLTGHPTAEAADRHGGDGLGAIRGIVQITVPMLILIGQPSRTPATLAGKCPIDADTARQIAGAATLWHRVLTDPATGHVAAVDRRFPTGAQRRHLQARDEHCRAPGCRMPVWRCDIDHTIDHAHGGHSSTCNLEHLCRRHHMLTTPPGRSNNPTTGCSCGPAPPAGSTPTGHHPHSASSPTPNSPTRHPRRKPLSPGAVDADA